MGGAISDTAEKDSGGASRILHHIEYLDEELDLVIYSSKVSTFERELGCDGVSETEREARGSNQGTRVCIDCRKTDNGINSHEGCSGEYEYKLCAPVKNNHPTLKPIKLNYQVAKLLKTPNPQTVCFPFSGSGSEVIGFEQAGYDPELFECSELSTEYVEIQVARRKAWKDLDINNLESTKKHIEKKSKENKDQGSLF